MVLGTMAPPRATETTEGVARGNVMRLIGFVASVVVLGGVCVLSIMVGARTIPASEVFAALFSYDGSDAHSIIRELRVPRTVLGLVVGPALGVCGALIQAYTRNPLADPGILGVNAGAACAVTLGVGLGFTSASGYVWFSFAGALLATVLVYAIGSRGPAASMPEKLVLAGVATGAVLGGVTTTIVIKNIELYNDLRFWGVGSLGGREVGVIASVAPFIVLGLIISVVVAPSLNAFALGEDLGRSLGANVVATRIATITAVTLLAGGATALAGPIAFVGLMVPHVVRWFTGPDQRWIMPYSMVVAAILLIASDILGRILLANGELRVGIVTAIIGAPVLIFLARRRTASGL